MTTPIFDSENEEEARTNKRGRFKLEEEEEEEEAVTPPHNREHSI